MKKKVVLDATVFINFAKAKAVNIIRQLLAGNAVVLTEVKNELFTEKTSVEIRDAIREGWIEERTLTTPGELTLFSKFSERLGKGEAASLVLAKIEGLAIATDDLAARKMAKKVLGPSAHVTGTVGLLLRAARQGLCTLEKAEEIHKTMRAIGYRSPVESLSDIYKKYDPTT